MFHVILYQPEIPPNTGNIIRLCANTGCRLHLVKPLGFTLEDKLLKRAGLDYHEFATLRVHDTLVECLESLPHTRDTLLMEPLAIRLGESTTLAKSLVMAQPADCGSGCEAAIPAPDASQRRVMAGYPNPPPSPLSNFPPQAGEKTNEKSNLQSFGEGANVSLRELIVTRRVFALTTKGSQAFHQTRYQAGDAFLFGPESRGLPPAVLDRFATGQRVRLPMLPHSRSLNLSNAVAVTVFEAWRQNGFVGG